MIGELLVTLAVLLGIYGKRAMTRWLFQRRRRANVRLGGSSVSSDVLNAARGMLGMNAWEEFANDPKFLRDNWVTPSELEALKHASLMGSVTCKEDIMFILNAIRGPARGRRP
jgi:hypothetical protein